MRPACFEIYSSSVTLNLTSELKNYFSMIEYLYQIHLPFRYFNLNHTQATNSLWIHSDP